MVEDQADTLAEQIRQAGAEDRKLVIAGSNSKVPALSANLLPVAGHTGVVGYNPEELVLTARNGTSLKEIEALLGQHRQHLPFEPPMIGSGGTLGGAVATGWAGPGRPWRGSVRDLVLGVEMINGLGQRLKFGGQVMKNVAGYDLSRLQAGAWGSLGVLLSVSLRLTPMPDEERNCRLECTANQGLSWMRTWTRTFSPLSATCHYDGVLNVRLSGPKAAVDAAAKRIGGETSSDMSFWRHLRHRTLPFFQHDPSLGSLWQINCAPAADLPPTPCLIEWAGARRWWWTRQSAKLVQAYAAKAEGAVVRAGLVPNLHSPVMVRLKQAFDPKRLLNPHLFDANPV